MRPMDTQLRRRRIAAVVAAVVAAAALAFPVLGASPSPSSAPAASAKAHGNGNGKGNGPKPDKPANAQGVARSGGAAAKGNPAAKPDKSHEPETPVTLHGTITKGTDADGRPTFTLAADGKTYVLSAGPPWFWGDENPLAKFAGKSVTVVGESEADGDVDVQSVDGTALRDPGRPPWAGGPKEVGPRHPGYKAWKAAKDHGPKDHGPKASGDADEPEASEAP